MARTHSRSPKAKQNEQGFAVRLRVKVPELGFGKLYDEMFAWLDANVGRGNYDHGSNSLPGMDATNFYFHDPKFAVMLLEEFDLEIAEYPPKD